MKIDIRLLRDERSGDIYILKDDLVKYLFDTAVHTGDAALRNMMTELADGINELGSR